MRGGLGEIDGRLSSNARAALGLGSVLVNGRAHPLTELTSAVRWFGPPPESRDTCDLPKRYQTIAGSGARGTAPGRERIEGEIGALAPNTSGSFLEFSGNPESNRQAAGSSRMVWIRARRAPHRAAAAAKRKPGKTRGWKLKNPGPKGEIGQGKMP